MPPRAVYASQTLNIYITRDALDLALTTGIIRLPLEIGGHVMGSNGLMVVLDYETTQILRTLVDQERAAVTRGRARAGHIRRSVSLDPEDERSHHAGG